MIFGSFTYGFIQDKCGNKAALITILLEIVVFQTMLLVQNEYHVFNWTAHVSMFGMGMLDNTL